MHFGFIGNKSLEVYSKETNWDLVMARISYIPWRLYKLTSNCSKTIQICISYFICNSFEKELTIYCTNLAWFEFIMFLMVNTSVLKSNRFWIQAKHWLVESLTNQQRRVCLHPSIALINWIHYKATKQRWSSIWLASLLSSFKLYDLESLLNPYQPLLNSIVDKGKKWLAVDLAILLLVVFKNPHLYAWVYALLTCHPIFGEIEVLHLIFGILLRFSKLLQTSSF